MLNQSVLNQVNWRDPEFIAEITKGVINGLETKAPAAAPNFTPLHGVTSVGAGIFSGQGLEQDVIGTVVRPHGIASILSIEPSVDTNPQYPALTGISDDIGNEPDNECDAAPTGFIKACNLTAQFGRVLRDTNTIVPQEVMLRINRGDFTDLRFIGKVMGLTPFIPSGLNPDQIIDMVLMSEMIQTAIRMERVLNRHMWQGSPANNQGTGYREFPGLDNQIATGQVDVDTGTLCPSLDSDVKDFTFNNVDGSDGKDIVEYMSMLEFFITDLADKTGMDPATWAFAMPRSLWQELTAVWPCAYNTNKCTSIGGDARVFTDGRENIRDRDSMRTSKIIEINGNPYPVVLDSGILELNSTTNGELLPGEFASDIYMVPLTAGGIDATFMEHVDYRQAMASLSLLRGKEPFWTNDGRFFWAIEHANYCFNLKLKTEQRVVLRMPQLAGKIQNVKWSPLQHLRDADPSSPYHVDGGVSARSTPTKNAVWL